MPDLSNEVAILYNEVRDLFFISKSDHGFSYCREALAHIQESITGGALFEGEFVGCSTKHIGDFRYVVSNPFDFSLRGRKTIRTITLGVISNESVQVALDWRNTTSSDFQRSRFFPLSPEGTCEPIVEGVEFRVVVRVPITATMDLESVISITYQINDKRMIRGAYAPAEGTA